MPLQMRQLARSLFRSPLESAISILGLAIGLAAAILIILFVRDESAYDAYWPDIDRLYRLETTFILEGRAPLETILAMGPSKAAFESYFENEVETVARINRRTPTVKRGDNVFADRVALVDPEVLNIFPFEAIFGDMAQTLADTRSIALSETAARKYFGEADPIGQTLSLAYAETTDDYVVGAIYRDLPQNTHLEIDAMIPIDEVRFQVTPWLFESWFAVNNHVYVKLKPGASGASVAARLDDFADASAPMEEGPASDVIKFRLFPVRDIHLEASGFGEMKPRGDGSLVIAFLAIAALIVIVGAVNFINLATARAGLRGREIALRKVVGASRNQLIVQLLGESLVVTGLATLLAIVLVEVALPTANAFLGRNLPSLLGDPLLLLSAVPLWIGLGVVSGVYPAMLVSAFRPGPLLHDEKKAQAGGSGLGRNILVALQSAVTIGLIAATGVVAAQLALFRSIDKGFEEEGLIALGGTYRDGISDQREALKEEIRSLPQILSAGYVSEAPSAPNEMNMTVSRAGDDNHLMFGQVHVDHDFIETYRIPLVAGRGFDRGFAMDKDPITADAAVGDVLPANILINQMAVEKLGYANAEAAIGQRIRATLAAVDGGEIIGDLTIVGVLPDVHFHSIKQEPRPEVYSIGQLRNNLIVRYQGDGPAVIGQVEAVWKRMAPDVPFDYFFVDQSMAKELEAENAQMILFFVFAMLTIVIAALGLYGLATFATERRVKEIGIRRVLGARVGDIFRLLLWQFSKPVFGAVIVASPLAVIAMTGWLEKFPYRIETLAVTGFTLAAGVAALLITWATVTGVSLRVARSNPIKALKHE